MDNANEFVPGTPDLYLVEALLDYGFNPNFETELLFIINPESWEDMGHFMYTVSPLIIAFINDDQLLFNLLVRKGAVLTSGL